MALRIRSGDLVQVIAGVDRGKQGRVTAVDPQRSRVRVEKVRIQKHHLKPGRKGARAGGVVESEGFIDASNVMLVDPASGERRLAACSRRVHVDAIGCVSSPRYGRPTPRE